MQQSDQETNPYQTAEIDLKKLFNPLIKRKLFIFVLTSFVTLLAIIYVLNTTPIYKSSSSFVSPSDSSIININRYNKSIININKLTASLKLTNETNKLKLTDETKDSVFNSFLTWISSRELQKQIFIDGGFLTALNPKNEPINDVDGFISGFLDSIALHPPGLTERDLKFGFLTELPYTVSIEGENAEVITNYLNDLVVGANTQTINELISIVKQKIDIYLDEILIERGALLTKTRQDRLSQIERIKEEDAQRRREIIEEINRSRIKAKQDRLNEIVILTNAAKLANSLGIVENNFTKLSLSKDQSNLIVAFGENNKMNMDVENALEKFPDWFLYGEKALLERIKLLENRVNDDPYIPEIVKLNNELIKIQNNTLLKTLETRQDDSPFSDGILKLDMEKNKLESIIVDMTGINAMQLSQVAITPKHPIKPNKRKIVLLVFISGFMMSILLALFMEILKPDEKNST